MKNVKIEKTLGEYLKIKRKIERSERAIEAVRLSQGKNALRLERDALVQELELAKKRIEALIARLPRDEMRQILKYKYIHGVSMEELADIMFFSLRHCYRLNKKAIELLSEHCEQRC